jgi:salicylate hydroxylase
MGERRPFIIAGAGIAGLTTALALAARGLPVRVIERSRQLSEVGAGIQLAPNAGRVLAALGLDAAIAAAAVEPVGIDIVNGRTGRRLASLKGATFRTAYGISYRVIHRADLQRVLLDAARRLAIPIELGASIDRLAPDATAMVAEVGSATGKETVAAEAVIAADGVWSSLRAMIPGAAQPFHTGRTAWRAIVPADAVRDVVAIDRVGLWVGPDVHLVHYPVSGGAAVNLVAVTKGGSDRADWNAAGDPRILTARFAGWAAPARTLIAAAATWQTFPLVTVDPSRAWLGDRLVLLGDAAHAMPPFLAQGAAMGIEDAAVLAEALSAGPDTATALKAYVAARQPRAVAVAAASVLAGRRFHLRGLAALARNVALRLAGARLILARNRAIYRWQPPTTSGGRR